MALPKFVVVQTCNDEFLGSGSTVEKAVEDWKDNAYEINDEDFTQVGVYELTHTVKKMEILAVPVTTKKAKK